MLQERANYFQALSLLIVFLSFASCTKDVIAPKIITGSWTSTGFTSNYKAYILGTNDSSIFVSSGLLYRTSDNGNHWTTLYDPNNSLNGQCFCALGNNIYLGFVDGIFMSVDNGNNWNLIGSNLGGTINSLTAKGGTIYAGTLCGVHATENNASWTNLYAGFPPSTSSYPYLGVESLIIKDTNLYAGTIGLYSFDEQNLTWAPASNGLPSDWIMSLAVVGNSLIAGTMSHGVYISNDNGANWTEINNGLPQNGSGYYQISSITTFNNYIFVILQGRIYLSTNNGNNWSLVSGFPTTNSIQTSVLVKDNILFCGGGNIIDPNQYHYQITGQIWNCPLSSLH